MELNEELFADYMGRPELRDLISNALGEQVYKRLHETDRKSQA
jgi:type I restriction enzyme R subunit